METARQDDSHDLSSEPNPNFKARYNTHKVLRLLNLSRSSTPADQIEEKVEVEYSAHIEDIGVDKDGLTGYLMDIRNALLKCTKPNPSKREKSDLSIWREIFALYDRSSVFCLTKECSCLDSDFGAVQIRYESFHSCIAATDHVCSIEVYTLICIQTRRFQHPKSGQVFMAFKGLIAFIMDILVPKTSGVLVGDSEIGPSSLSSERDSISNYKPSECLTARLLAEDNAIYWSHWLCFQIYKLTSIIPVIDDYSCPICAGIVWKPGMGLNI